MSEKMNNPSKRQCRRIDKALSELSSNLSAQKSNGRNYSKVCSLLQFILKEYCQSTSGLQLLSDTDFKDYFLIIISDENSPSSVINALLSIIFNSSKVPHFFSDLMTSPITKIVLKKYFDAPDNYFRSLRFLVLCMKQKRNDFVFPLNNFQTILLHCSENISNQKKHSEIFQISCALLNFFTLYISHHMNLDWILFIEENDVSLVVTIILELFSFEKDCQQGKPKNIFEIAKISLSMMSHSDSPESLDDSLKGVLSEAIIWFASEKSPQSLDLLLNLYQQQNLRIICYLSESERNGIFYSMLFSPCSPYRLKVATIYLQLCQEGSYRTQLVDKSFCTKFHTILSERNESQSGKKLLEHLKVCNVILSIFFTFNSGESLLKIAIESGIFDNLLSFIQLISTTAEIREDKIVEECNRLLPKTYFLLQKTTNYKILNHNLYLSFIKILKRFRSLFCLNYLLFLSQTVPFSYLSFHSFISLVYHEFDCSCLSIEEQYFDLKSIRSAPKSMKNLENLPKCGNMILSNILHNLEFSSFSTPWALSEGLLLLRKVPLINTVLEKNLSQRIAGCNADMTQHVNILVNTCSLVHWLSKVLNVNILVMGVSNFDDVISIPCSEQLSTHITISNKSNEFSVSKDVVMASSTVFQSMFKHQFREVLESFIYLNYLSDESLACFQDYLLGNGELIEFSFETASTHHYPWSVGFQLLSFSTMFEIRGLHDIILNSFSRCNDSSIVLSVCKFSFAHYCPTWILAVSQNIHPKLFDGYFISLEKLKFFNVYLFNEFAKPLLTKFCSKI